MTKMEHDGLTARLRSVPAGLVLERTSTSAVKRRGSVYWKRSRSASFGA